MPGVRFSCVHPVDRQSAGAASPEVSTLVVTPDRLRLISACNRTIALWEAATGQLIGTRAVPSAINGVALTPDAEQLVLACEDNDLFVLNFETGFLPRKLEGHSGPVRDVALTPDGRFAISASADHTLRLWELASGLLVRTFGGNARHWGRVNAVAVLPDGRRAISASSDETVRIWDLDIDWRSRIMEEHTGPVNGIAITPDGTRALSASSDKTLVLWQVTGRDLRVFEGHSGEVSDVAISPDGTRAASAGGDETVRIWDLGTGATTAAFSCAAPLRCCTFIDDGRVAAGDRRGQIYFFDL